jgi:uncharacterized protein (TIGR02147 family)
MQKGKDYRAVLLEELETREARNPAYSRRAFARDLGLSAGFLSDLLHGQKRLTEKRAYAIAEKLGMSEHRTRQFTALVRLELARDPRSRGLIESELAALSGGASVRFEPIQSDAIRDNFSWLHFAIYEIATLADFVNDPRWIARKLGITVVEAETTLGQLVRAGMLENEGGTLRPASPFVVFQKPPAEKIQRFHRTMLDRARASLPRHGVDAEFGSIIMAYDSARLPEAIEIMRRFQAEMAELSLKTPKRRLYHLGIQFYPITEDADMAPSAAARARKAEPVSSDD